MTKLQRIRLDPDGLITQNQYGMMKRIVLPLNIVEDVRLRGISALQDLALQYPHVAELFDPYGQLSARFEIILDEADCLNRPLRIYFGIEPRCNLTCEFCGPRDWHDKFVPGTDEMENFLLQQIADAGAYQVQLTGGEIGLRGFDLLHVLDKTCELGLAVILSTNGVWSCIDRKQQFLEALAGFDNIIQTKISIEGTPEFHNSVRGDGTYGETVDTLAKLSDFRLNPRISTTVFRESCNNENLTHLVGLAKTYAAGFQPIPVRAIGRASKMKLHVPSHEQLYAYTEYATKLRRDTGIPISFNFDILDKGRQVPIFDINRPTSCGAPMWGVHVTHTGEVFPCGFAQEAGKGKQFLAGVVSHEHSLLDIWLHSEVLYQVRHAGKDERCQQCDDYGHGCWGGVLGCRLA